MTSPALLPTATLTAEGEQAGRSATVFAVTPTAGTALTTAAAPATQRPGTAETLAAIVTELSPRFAGQLPGDVIEQCVAQAVRDLHESICKDALPEMAIRLAAVRLDRRVQQEADRTVRITSA